MLGKDGIFSSAYAGSVRYYAAMLGCNHVHVDASERYGKYSWNMHHCRIVGANGVQTLTIPLVKPVTGSVATLKDLVISEHGDWRRIHWGALFSAYGKSPFFDYIADELHSIYENQGITNLYDFNKAIHNLVVDFLDLPIRTSYCEEAPLISDNTTDFRRRVGSNKSDNLPFISDIPYWQVWQSRYGFTPDMSILDLLMTQGRESLLILHQMLTQSISSQQLDL